MEVAGARSVHGDRTREDLAEEGLDLDQLCARDVGESFNARVVRADVAEDGCLVGGIGGLQHLEIGQGRRSWSGSLLEEAGDVLCIIIFSKGSDEVVV